MPVNSYHWHFAKHIQNSVRLRVLIFGNVIAHLVYIHLYQRFLSYYFNAFQHGLALLHVDGAKVECGSLAKFYLLGQVFLAHAAEHNAVFAISLNLFLELSVLVGQEHSHWLILFLSREDAYCGVRFTLAKCLVHQHALNGGLSHYYC